VTKQSTRKLRPAYIHNSQATTTTTTTNKKQKTKNKKQKTKTIHVLLNLFIQRREGVACKIAKIYQTCSRNRQKGAQSANKSQANGKAGCHWKHREGHADTDECMTQVHTKVEEEGRRGACAAPWLMFW
jgi:hypothetical protein